MVRLSVFKQAGIFQGLDGEETAVLAALAIERRFKSGEAIFWEGDAPETFYVVTEGRVKVFKQSSTGKDFILAFFGQGEVFGEVAVLEDKPYPASAQAVSDSIVLGIRKETLLTFLSSRPRLALRLIGVLGERLREAQARLKDIAGERVEQRLARMLLMLSDKLGTELPFTRQEIADMAGTTTETAIRFISRLKEDGIVQTARGRITILDKTKLSQLAESAS